MSYSMIGGADGPTSIFLAGKIGSGGIGAAAAAVLLILVTVCVIRKKRRKDNKGDHYRSGHDRKRQREKVGE